MFADLILFSLAPRPVFVGPAVSIVEPASPEVLTAQQCSEVSRWYAWTTDCGGKDTCCKLFIACEDGTVVTQVVDSTNCN